MIAAQIIQMLKLQDAVNVTISPGWRYAEYPWSKAVFVECGELIEHLGWKWWKHHESDEAQAILELIDIWHFLLSAALEQTEGDVQAATREILEGWEDAGEFVIMRGTKREFEDSEDVSLHDRIMLLPVVMALGTKPTVALFRSICNEIGLDADHLAQVYIQKNTLNLFRIANGYQDGTYIKNWNGKEDNQVLNDIVRRSECIDPVVLTAKLAEAYAAVAK